MGTVRPSLRYEPEVATIGRRSAAASCTDVQDAPRKDGERVMITQRWHGASSSLPARVLSFAGFGSAEPTGFWVLGLGGELGFGFRVPYPSLGCPLLIRTVHALSDAGSSSALRLAALAESDGVHFSFYSIDTVAHSTILRAASSTFEKDCHRSQLAIFGLTTEELEAAREQMSGGAELPVDDEQSVRAEAAARAEAVARERR